MSERTLRLELGGVAGELQPQVDILIDGIPFRTDLVLDPGSDGRDTDVLFTTIDLDTFESLEVVFKNDIGLERVDVVSASIDGVELDLSKGVYETAEGFDLNGETLLVGQYKMYTNGSFTLGRDSIDYARLNATPPADSNNGSGFVAAPTPVFEQADTTDFDPVVVGRGGGGVRSPLESIIGRLAGARIENVVEDEANDGSDKGGSNNGGAPDDAEGGPSIPTTTGPGLVFVSAAPIASGEDTQGGGQSSGDDVEGGPSNGGQQPDSDQEPSPSVPDEPIAQQPDPEPEPQQPVVDAPVVEDRPVVPTGDSDWGGVDPNLYRGENYDHKSGSAPSSGLVYEIPVGTSVDQIHKIIDNAPTNQHVVLRFAEGEHRLNKQLLIDRGDITIEGAGENKTTFVADFDKGKIDNLIVVKSDDINDRGVWFNKQHGLDSKVTSNFEFGDTSVEVSNSSAFKKGDFIILNKPVGGGSPDYASMARVVDVKGDDLILDRGLAFSTDEMTKASFSQVEVYKVDLIEDVVLQDFGIRYDFDVDPNADSNVRFNNYEEYATGDGQAHNPGKLDWGHSSALVVSGTYGAQLNDIKIEDAGSKGFFFSTNLEVKADQLSVDGVLNKGVGGNGYGLEYHHTFFSDFTNLDIMGARHGVSAQKDGFNGFNNIHVARTDSNVDFHGGDDEGNIVFVEQMLLRGYYLPDLDSKDFAPNYAKGLYQFDAIDYRYDGNAEANTVVFKHVEALGGEKGPDGRYYTEDGQLLTFPTYSAAPDNLEAALTGGYLDGGHGDDYLRGNEGNDTLVGGSENDTFIIGANGGTDHILDFEQGDTVVIRKDLNGVDIDNGSEVLARAKQTGSDVVIDLGQGNSLVLENVELDNLKASSFDVRTGLQIDLSGYTEDVIV